MIHSHLSQGQQAPDADVTVTLKRAALNSIMLGETKFEDETAAGIITLDGEAAKLLELFSMFDTYKPDFPIVTP
jgi:alkyl sulfatase BDS1-like metallo-beta-lactamase superfamily hydrolase